MRPCSLVSVNLQVPFWKDPKYLLACRKRRVGYWQGNGNGKGIERNESFFYKKKGVNQAANIWRMKRRVSER